MRAVLQMLVLAALVAGLVCEIPRRAWSFAPRAIRRSGPPAVSFIALDAATYANMRHRLAFHGTLPRAAPGLAGEMPDAPLDTVARADDLPPPGMFPLAAEPVVTPAFAPSFRRYDALKPVSLAAPDAGFAPPRAARDDAARRDTRGRGDMLDFEAFETLRERK